MFVRLLLPRVVDGGVLLRRLRRLPRRDGEAPVEEVLVVLVLVERRLRRQTELGKLACGGKWGQLALGLSAATLLQIGKSEKKCSTEESKKK